VGDGCLVLCVSGRGWLFTSQLVEKLRLSYVDVGATTLQFSYGGKDIVVFSNWFLYAHVGHVYHNGSGFFMPVKPVLSNSLPRMMCHGLLLLVGGLWFSGL